MTTASAGTTELASATFRRLRDLIYERSGICLGENKLALVKSRISKRMRQLNLYSVEDYLDKITGDKSGGELQILLDAISTNVTSFYRESHHFELLRDTIKEWVNNGQRTFRCWSTACSTGQEPYTLGIELLEAIGRNKIDIKILATDLAPSVLKEGLRGLYASEKLEPVPKHLRLKYFSRVKRDGADWYAIGDRVRDMVLFRQFNLTAFPYPLRGPLDVIFCRNVMIYFDHPIRKKIISELLRLLRPGGLLFVGQAETLSGMSEGFRTMRPSVYRKEA